MTNLKGKYELYKHELSIRIVFDIPSDLVPQRFAGDDGNFLADSLVGVEVKRQSSVVLLDDQLGSLLHGLGTYAALHISPKNRNNTMMKQESAFR